MMMDKKFKKDIRDAVIIMWISLIAFFVTGEVFVRIFKKGNPPMVVASKNEKLVYELNKKFKGINSLGMRGKEIKSDDLKNHYRIAVLGDSHTASIKVENVEETFPAKLEKYLNQSLGSERAKILNLGVPGYNTAQELEVLKSKALTFEPQLVILQYCINDTHVCNYLQPEHKRLNSLIYKSKLLVKIWEKILYSSWGQKFLYEWVGSRFPDALLFEEGLVGTRKAAEDETPVHKHHPPRTLDRVPLRYHYMLGQENWTKHIQIFAQMCKQKNISLLATGFIGEEEKAAFLKVGFDVYSFYDMFKDKDMREYGYDLSNTADHFDARGCDFVGKALADYIHNHYFKN